MRRQVHLPLYAVLVLCIMSTFGPVISVVAAIKVQQSQQAKVREESRLRSCALFGNLLDVYVETPPTTPAGRNVQKAYRSFYNDNRCQPPR